VPAKVRLPSKRTFAATHSAELLFWRKQIARARCDHVVTLTVATDPMNSDVTGWLNGELGLDK